MSRRPTLDEQLAALQSLRDAPGGPGTPHTPEALDALRRALRGRSSFLVAKAAEIAAEAGLPDLLPDLLHAFDRYIQAPHDTDKGCKAKTALAAALDKLGCDDEAPFLRALRHVQKEPVWGGSVDTAAELRAIGAAALVRLNHPDVLSLLADLLTDPEAAARAGAARALAYRGGLDAAALLRLRLRIGDPEPQVVQECLLGILQLQPRQGLELATELLDAPDPITQEAAALALGQSRLDGALAPLRRWTERSLDPDARRVGLTAIAVLRLDDALAYLVGLVREAPAADAREAIGVLAMYRHDPALARRVRDAAAAHPDDLTLAFDQAFGPGTL